MQLDNINPMNFNKISNHPQAQTQQQQTQQLCSSNDKSGSYEGDVCSSNRNSISSNKSQSIDAYADADADTDVDDMNNNMVTKFAFPFKLHSILENAEKMNRVDIVSWLPSGKAFKIHKPKDFADTIMPQYFNQTKYRSFQRQLYIYNFDRVKDKASNEYGAYVHELFIRGDSDLCVDMTRQKIKGTGLSNEERRQKAALSKKKKKVNNTINSKHNSNTPIDDNTVKISKRKQQQQQQQQQSYPSIKSNTATSSLYQQPLSLNQNRKQLAALLSSSKNILTSSSLLSPSSIITPTPFMSSSSSMHPSLDVQSSSSIGSSMNSNTVQQQEQLPRRVSEWNTRLEQMLSSRKPFLQQQPQQQRKGIPRRVSEWNNDAIALAAIRQQQQQQQHSFQMNINTTNNNNNNIINSNSNNNNNSFQYLNGENNNNSSGGGGGGGRTNTNNHYGRRCSLGFDRSVGRRNSLLHDGDVVNFNNKQFFFTTEY